MLQAGISDDDSASLNAKGMRQAIIAGFAMTDAQALARAEQHGWVDGAVCVAVWIIQETVCVANVGLIHAALSLPVLVMHARLAHSMQQLLSAIQQILLHLLLPSIAAECHRQYAKNALLLLLLYPGDAKCVLARKSADAAEARAIVLTKEHKALFPAERKRIEKAGGHVSNGRLQGVCAAYSLICFEPLVVCPSSLACH